MPRTNGAVAARCLWSTIRSPQASGNTSVHHSLGASEALDHRHQVPAPDIMARAACAGRAKRAPFSFSAAVIWAALLVLVRG